MFQLDEIIHHKYKILNKFAETKSSIIYEVQDTTNHRQIMKVAKQIDSFINEQIENEAKLLARMDHARIPHLYDKFIWNHDYTVLVMQKMPGTTLSTWVKEEQAFLLWEDMINITDQLIDIITYFHTQNKPVMLLDLKPTNILITDDLQISLVDFGSSMEVSKHSRKKIAVGTIGFAAPEQFEVGKASLQSDLFSLGAILFFILSGGKNIYTSSIEEYDVHPNVPDAYIYFIKKLTEVKLHKRFTNIHGVEAAFHRLKLTNTEKLTYFLQKIVSYRK